MHSRRNGYGQYVHLGISGHRLSGSDHTTPFRHNFDPSHYFSNTNTQVTAGVEYTKISGEITLLARESVVVKSILEMGGGVDFSDFKNTQIYKGG